MGALRVWLAALVGVACGLTAARGAPPPCAASVAPSSTEAPDTCDGVLVRFDADVPATTLSTVMETALAVRRVEIPAGLYWLKPPPGPAGLALLDMLKTSHGVRYVEPNLRFHGRQGM